MKCLEFKLPSGSAGMAAGYTRAGIKKQLDRMLNENKIGPYKQKTQGYRFKVWLDKEQDYTIFFLLWEVRNQWHTPELTDEVYTED